MGFYELLRRRRMVRNYRPDPVPPQALERILEATRRGPSAGYSQGVALVLVQDPGRRQAIAALAGEERYRARGFPPWLSVAPVHVVLCVEPERYVQRYSRADKIGSQLSGTSNWPVPYWYVDAGAAMMLFLLAAVEEGLTAGFQGAHNLPGIGELLSIPPEVRVVGLLTLGYYSPDNRSRSLEQGRRPGHQQIHRETWNICSDEANTELTDCKRRTENA